MNALVDIYLDNNLGDNIMGETLIRYLESLGVRCFLLANDDFTNTDIINNNPNTRLITSITKRTLRENDIGLYVRIGGSMFPHNNFKEGIFRYLTLVQYMKMKRMGIKIYILGCNMGPFHSSVGIGATKKIIKIADMVTCRDNESFSFIFDVKKKNCYMYPDVVFSRQDLLLNCQERDVLGISTYTGYILGLRTHNLSYSKLIVDVIDTYLEKNPQGRVKLFVFDSGYNSDYPTTHKIYSKAEKKERIEIVAFTGDILSFMKEFNKCSVMIGTRFHSIVLALLCKIPVLPIVYSNKSKNLLLDLNYKGQVLEIADCNNVNVGSVVEAVCSKNSLLVNRDPKVIESAKGHLKVLSDHMKKDLNIG